MAELTKRNLELIIIKYTAFEHNPSIALILCEEFGLNWERIQKLWLYKSNYDLFKKTLNKLYGSE